MKNRFGSGLVCAFQVFFSIFLYGQTNKEPADVIVTGGTVVTMDGPRSVYNDGAVVVRGDTIVAVGPRAELESKYEGRQTINAKNKLVLPGFINGHTHVPMTLFRGLRDDVTLNDWLYKYIFPAEAKNVNEDFVRWGTRHLRVCGFIASRVAATAVREIRRIRGLHPHGSAEGLPP